VPPLLFRAGSENVGRDGKMEKKKKKKEIDQI
jgi:hypothetical protein